MSGPGERPRVSGPLERPRVLYVYGVGGQGREAAWFARARWGRDLDVRFVVDDPRFLPDDPAPNVGLVSAIVPLAGAQWVAAVGDIATRHRAVEALAATGLPAARIVHPSVDLSGVEILGDDIIISAGAVLSVGVVVHSHVHVNLGATVSHDVILGEYATLSPGVNVAGWVEIRPGTFIGAGASIINGAPGQRLVIGDGASVAAGACVLESIEPASMYAGVPARRKR